MSTDVAAKNYLVKVYKKESRSPWRDASTVLPLADVVASGQEELVLGFETYIYLHKGLQGEVLGISISKKVLNDNPRFDSRYLSGPDMYSLLLLYLSQIVKFTEHYRDCFEALYLVTPKKYFKTAKKYWAKQAAMV